MSSIKVSDYLFFLKTCYFGHQLLEKCYQIIKQLHRELLLEARQQGELCFKALKDFSFFIDDAGLSMRPSYLSFLEGEILKEEARSQRAVIPIWDYSLVLNDQENIHTLLNKRDIQLRKLLKKIEDTYRFHAWARGLFWVEQLKKPQAAAQFMNEKILGALKKTQTFLDKMPIIGDAGGIGDFEVLMQHLKEYKAFITGRR